MGGPALIHEPALSAADSEMSAAVATTTTLVRDLRVAVWGEHCADPRRLS